MRNLLRIRNVRIYLLGDVISTLGDNALWLAMAIWIKEMTGSSAWAGLVFFSFAVGNLFSPLGGVLADRFRRKPLLICANLLAAALVLLILLVHGRGSMWLVFAVMFAYGVVGSAMGPAETALLPALVPAELLADANGVRQTLTEGLRLITPVLGAGLFALAGGGVVAIIDAATFLAAVATLLALRVDEPAPSLGRAAAPDTAVPDTAAAGTAAPDIAAQRRRGQLSGGFRFLAREPLLRSVTIALALTLLTLGFTESAGFSVVTAGLHRTAAFVGVLITAQGVGAVAGGSVAAPLLKRTSEAILIVLGLCCAAGAVLLLTVPNLVADLAGVVLAGVVGPWITVAAVTALQRRTPSELLGRVSGAFELSLTVPQVTSVGLGAALIAVVSYRVLLVAVAIVAAIAAAYLLATPESRRPHPAAGDTAVAEASAAP
jgi:MFS family permease